MIMNVMASVQRLRPSRLVRCSPSDVAVTSACVRQNQFRPSWHQRPPPRLLGHEVCGWVRTLALVQCDPAGRLKTASLWTIIRAMLAGAMTAWMRRSSHHTCYRRSCQEDSSKLACSNFRTRAFSVTVRILSSGKPSGRVASISTVIRSSPASGSARCCKISC